MSAESSCPTGKQWTLPNKQQAENVAKLIEWSEGDGVTRYAYQCAECTEWHVTRRQTWNSESRPSDAA